MTVINTSPAVHLHAALPGGLGSLPGLIGEVIVEAAVIQTALDEAHDAVILDDLKARRIAQTLGLQVTGTLGILLQAKQTGLLPSVRAAISTLEKQKDKMPGVLSSKKS